MVSEFEQAQRKRDLAQPKRQSPAKLDQALDATHDVFLQSIAPEPTRVASVLADADATTRTRVLTRLQQKRGNTYVQRVVSESREKLNRLQKQIEDEEEPRPRLAENISEAESAAEEAGEGTEAAELAEEIPGAGEIGAEIDASDGLIADSATEVLKPQIEAETEEAAEESTTSLTPISRCPAGEVTLTRQPVSVARAPVAGRARAAQVVLEFIPDEKKDASGPMGIIHVRVKGKEVARFFARGGPPFRGRDPNAPSHFIAPTPAGRYRVGYGMAVTAPSWAFSQLPWDTPMREVDTPAGKEVQYKRGKRWRSTKKLKTPLSRTDILTAEEALGRARAIPPRWNLNDFGRLAYHVRGTKSYIHTTPETEEQYRRGRPEKLTFSHGCIHIKPSDRDIMIARGYLQAGVRLIVRKYRRRSKWGTPP